MTGQQNLGFFIVERVLYLGKSCSKYVLAHPYAWRRCSRRQAISYWCAVQITVHGKEFSELKIPYRTVVGVDFADLACGIFLKNGTPHSRYFSDELGVPNFLSRSRTNVCYMWRRMIYCKHGERYIYY